MSIAFFTQRQTLAQRAIEWLLAWQALQVEGEKTFAA